MTVKQISTFLENRPGKLAEFTKVLSDNDINIRALSVSEASDFGIVRIIVEDVYNATTVLKDANYICSVTNVLAVEVKDEAGALASLISILGKDGINVEYMYAITTHKQDVAYMIIRPDDQEKAIQSLNKAGIRIAAAEQLF